MTKSLTVFLFAVLVFGLIVTPRSFAQPASSPAAAAPSAAPAQSPAAAAPAPAAQPSGPAAEETPAPRFHGIGAATILTVHGKIAAVNPAKRLVTLIGPAGNRFTLKVSKDADLSSVKKGDPFVVRFFESVHIRRKRAGEVLPAVSIKEGISRATPGESPAGVVHTKSKVVLKVTAIDIQNQTVTVKDPDGDEETAKVGNAKYLRHIKVGDDLVVTVRQAIAIALDKE
jgi:hypothetical protein